MKTTNKILLFTFLAIIAGMIAMLFYVRSHISYDVVAGSGNIVGQYRDVDDFTRVTLRGGMNVYLVQDTVNVLYVEADDNIVDTIVSNSFGGHLEVSLEAAVSQESTANVTIHFVSLEDLRSSGGVQLFAEEPLHGEFFSHRLQAGAQSTLHLQYDKIQIRAQAGAIANLKGRADTLELYSAAGAVINARNLAVRYCDLEAKAGSVNRLNVYGTLTGSATHGAVVDYYGDPVHVDLDVRTGVHIERSGTDNSR